MKKLLIFQHGTPIQKPYALYIHGLGSSAASGTKSSLARSLEGYEWLTPEITHNPFESLDILNEWVANNLHSICMDIPQYKLISNGIAYYKKK